MPKENNFNLKFDLIHGTRRYRQDLASYMAMMAIKTYDITSK